MKLLLISGSLRQDSYNRAIIDYIHTIHPDSLVYDGLDSLPFYTPDLDIHDLAHDDSPQSVRALRQAVRASDAVLISTPEYAFEIPGVLKNALEWLISSGELVDKPLSIISASTSALGGESAHGVLLKLGKILSARNPHSNPLCVDRVNHKIIDGIPNEELKSQLQVHLDELVHGETKPFDNGAKFEKIKAREPIFHRDCETWMVEDYWEIGASGARYDKEFILDTLEKRHQDPNYHDDWQIKDFEVREVGAHHYLATYTLIQDKTRTTRRSTLWHRNERGIYTVVYHQGTIVSSFDLSLVHNGVTIAEPDILTFSP